MAAPGSRGVDGAAFWIIAAAFIPAFVFLVWARAHERRDREPWSVLLALFAYGGTLGIALAILLNLVFASGYRDLGADLGVDAAIWAAVIAAPFLEELAKGVGLPIGRRHLDELEDGIIHGAAIGLGFGATENMIYGFDALWNNDLSIALHVIALRVMTSLLLHTATTAMLGFGYALVRKRSGSVFELLPFYLLAVVLHAGYNLLVLRESWIAFGFAVLVVFVVLAYLRRQVKELDALPHL